MAVQVWIGEKPEHPNERRAILALANGLQRLEGLHLILANFSVGGRTVDLVIIKHDAIVIIELKHCDGAVVGSVNGPWFVVGRNGERKRINPGRKNPYNQVISYFHALTNFLNEHRREFLSAQKANDVDFRTCKRVVVIAPNIQEGSQIELDWKVELKGMDELPAYLITERSSEIELNDEEMLAIPQLLYCTPWNEINMVLQGEAVPDSTVVGDPEALPPAPPEPTIVQNDDAVPHEPNRWITKLRGALGTTTGRIAAGMAGLALLLFLVLLFRPVTVVSPNADESLAPISGVPAPTGAPLASAAEAPTCTWTELQLVGKRYDSTTDTWQSVAVGDTTIAPDVVVALVRVSTCGSRIELTWNVQNNSDQVIAFPLRSDNIAISDGLGNEYTITDADSEPAEVRVDPGSQQEGTVVVRRPINRSATSLVVRLREEPFGEASFVVAIR